MGLWDNNKGSNFCIIGIPEVEDKKGETKKVFKETIFENFPNLVKDINIQIQKAEKIPNGINLKKSKTS